MSEESIDGNDQYSYDYIDNRDSISTFEENNLDDSIRASRGTECDFEDLNSTTSGVVQRRVHTSSTNE